MNDLLNNSIQRWRRFRNKKMLHTDFSAQYAFVGVGSHALQNLYPVLQYLGIRLKYICCKSPEKMSLVERRFGVKATTSPDVILNDSEVKGVFICASPQQHYELCRRMIASGKYVFIEKPPCRTREQLEKLIDADSQNRVMVGMQKRYSPLIEKLRACLSESGVVSYRMLYHTGMYPEGDPFTDLFIHPVDLVTYLFGNVDKMSIQRTDRKGKVTVQALLSHGNVKGSIELSTAYSWVNPEESLRVNTISGEYLLEQMERLSYYTHPKKIAGIPVEKLGIFTKSERILMERNNFNPLIANNQLFTQGFLPEIRAFADMVEGPGKNRSPLGSMKNTYDILKALKDDM